MQTTVIKVSGIVSPKGLNTYDIAECHGRCCSQGIIVLARANGKVGNQCRLHDEAGCDHGGPKRNQPVPGKPVDDEHGDQAAPKCQSVECSAVREDGDFIKTETVVDDGAIIYPRRLEQHRDIGIRQLSYC